MIVLVCLFGEAAEVSQVCDGGRGRAVAHPKSLGPLFPGSQPGVLRPQLEQES